MNEALKQLGNIKDLKIETNKDLKKFSTLQLKAKGTLVTAKTYESLAEAIKCLKNKKFIILGLGANQILEENYNGIYLKLSIDFNKSYFDQTHKSYILPASISLAVLTSHASKFGLIGWEVFTGVPATLGGAIFMNAGTNLGEISSLVTRVKYIDKEGELKEHIVKDDSFSYRKCNFLNLGDFVFEVELKNIGHDENIKKIIREYLLKRNNSQPMREKTCGCVFKNFKDSQLTCRAGEYIDIIGLKGLTFGDISISDLHANFMINKGSGTKEEMLKLIEIVSNELYLHYGIRFDTEVKF